MFEKMKFFNKKVNLSKNELLDDEESLSDELYRKHYEDILSKKEINRQNLIEENKNLHIEAQYQMKLDVNDQKMFDLVCKIRSNELKIKA